MIYPQIWKKQLKYYPFKLIFLILTILDNFKTLDYYVMSLIFLSEFEDSIEFCKSFWLAIINAAGDATNF